MKTTWKKFGASLLLSAAGVFSSPSMAAVDMFLDIPGVMGESKDAVRKDQIEVLAWSWGASNGSRNKNSQCILQDISLVKWIDRASPDLLMAALTGLVYEKATLVVRKPGANPLEYITVELSDVRVTSVATGGSGGESRLTENISLDFSSGTFTYIQQGDQGQALDPPYVTIIDGC